jgi:hypothetical protein
VHRQTLSAFGLFARHSRLKQSRLGVRCNRLWRAEKVFIPRTPPLMVFTPGGTRQGRFLWWRKAQGRGRRAPARFVN